MRMCVQNKEVPEIDDKKTLEIFEKMNFIRNFELEVKRAVDNGLINCPVYLSIGQESISSTVSSFFPADLIFAQHRAHSVYLSYNGDKEKLVDELLGKDSGCSQGKGGSPSIQDVKAGIIGHHGLIGENVPLAVGASLGDKSKKIVCFFGDGAAEEDYVFTSMAFAATHKLPILFICEDNDLSILTKKSERRNWELTDALKGIRMPCADISDDIGLISHYVNKFKDDLPAFINCRTHRHYWHVGTGRDKKPSQDRLNIIKGILLSKGFNKEVFEIESKTKKEVLELWKKRLETQ